MIDSNLKKEVHMRCNMKYAAIMTPLCLVIVGAMSQRVLHAQEASTEAAQSRPPVTVQEDQSSYTLANGILTARVSKQSGDLTSLVYKGIELLTDKSGHAGAYWSHDTSGGVQTIAKISIDPQSNGQERAEVSVKGISGGRKMGHGAAPARTATFPPISKFGTAWGVANRAFTPIAFLNIRPIIRPPR